MLGYVFPGQGAQHVGMGKALAQSHRAARQVFEEADDALGFSLSKLCFDGPAAELELTANAQPAILATSIAALRVLDEEFRLNPTLVAGHSLGEFSALVCAGALSLRDALVLVHKRGRFMQDAVRVGAGAMAAVIGLSFEKLEALCQQASQGEVASVANCNGGEQLVVAGHSAAVQRLRELAEQAGAVTRALSVSAPFHCSLMKPAAQALAPELAAAPFQRLRVPLVDGVSARVIRDAAALPQLLEQQVTAPIRWDRCVGRLISLRTRWAIEVGCGRTLSGLNRRIAPGLPTISMGAPDDLRSVEPLARDLEFLREPLGTWQLAEETGDLYSERRREVVWADLGAIESVDEERWEFCQNGAKMRRFGAMAVVWPNGMLHVCASEAWQPREDGAFVRKDRTAIISPTGEWEHFDPTDWVLEPTGTMKRRDETRIIWPDGSEWCASQGTPQWNSTGIEAAP
jgi:malonyl CoA-acyl carrier protein transacylase